MHKYQQVNFFSNVIKSIRPTYGNKEELATLTTQKMSTVLRKYQLAGWQLT